MEAQKNSNLVHEEPTEDHFEILGDPEELKKEAEASPLQLNSSSDILQSGP